MDGSGNLYGTTRSGGNTSAAPCGPVSLAAFYGGCGTVFRIDPAGHETVLYSFLGYATGDGQNPNAGLIMDSTGNLYGNAGGGTDGVGVVFKLDSSGHETVLYSFTATGSRNGNGGFPVGSLIMDSAGNLYGVTGGGGSTAGVCGLNGCGTVFKLDPRGNETVLYRFLGGSGDGANPRAGLIMDSAGNFYGTTNAGGTGGSGSCFSSGCGTVFKLDSTGKETVLHSFTGAGGDGTNPNSALVIDSAGNLYGTASGFPGNASAVPPAPPSGGQGIVFKLDSTGLETVLYTFTGSSGASPDSSLMRDAAGNLYGSTLYGGSANGGILFKLDPAGTETVLYNFPATNGDGAGPTGGLIMDSTGNLYGTTPGGGAGCLYFLNSGFSSPGCGSVFKLDPAGHETVLYRFVGSPDGRNPLAGLVMDSAGNLYGTTFGGGHFGTVFKLDSTGHETILYDFASGANPDGTYPSGNLIMDSAGNLYGTTSLGGTSGHGAVFKLDPAGHETLLYNFTGVNGDGANPYAGLIMDDAGNLYGTTLSGGANPCPLLPFFPSPVGFGVAGCGTVFKIDPTGHETVLYKFTGANGDGAYPVSGLTMDRAGNLYGTTFQGGNGSGNCSRGCGLVFKLDQTVHETVLYNFQDITGGAGTGGPTGSLIRDSAGNLYGTTSSSFGGFGGTVFKLDPTGHETVLYDFRLNTSGQNPLGNLLMDSAGNLYGTAMYGGSAGSGTVFKLPPLPTVNLSTTWQTFASQLKGTMSSPQAVTLSNTGNATLSISDITITGVDQSDFSETNTCGGSVALGATCTINVTFTPTSTGSRSATLSVTDDAPGSSQTVTLSGTGTDFSVGAASGGSTSATVTAGQNATYNLQVNPLSSFTGTVTISCSGAPTQATCSPSVSPVSVTGGFSVPVSVTVATTARSLLPSIPLRRTWPRTPQSPLIYSLLALLCVLAAIKVFDRDRAQPVRAWTTAIVLIASVTTLMTVSGCGGSSSPPPPSGTPTGTYTLTVTGTSQGENRTVSLTLTVN
jgi:uncharacterized repeat protein (TIGR03803 family)